MTGVRAMATYWKKKLHPFLNILTVCTDTYVKDHLKVYFSDFPAV